MEPLKPNDEIRREKETRADINQVQKGTDLRHTDAATVARKREKENLQHPGHSPPPPADRAGNQIPERDYPVSPFGEE